MKMVEYFDKAQVVMYPRYRTIASHEDKDFVIQRAKKVQSDMALNMSLYMEDGGSIAEGNAQMLRSNAKAIKHHAEELEQELDENPEVEAWVVAKGERAATDLSDITHYLDGRKFSHGGDIEHGVDLFEDYEAMPVKVLKVLGKYDLESGDYRELEKALKDLNSIGYTFEYELDGEPYDLRKIGQKGKSEFYAKGGSIKSLEKRVAEVNELIKRGNDLGIEVVDESTTWQAPMKYKPLKYTNGVLYISYEVLDLYNYNKTYSRDWEKKSYKIGKYESRNIYGYQGEAGAAQREALTEIARMYRKPLKSYDTYGYFEDGGEVNKVNPEKMKAKIEDILNKSVPSFYKGVSIQKNIFDTGNNIRIFIAASDYKINGVSGQLPQVVSLSLDLSDMDLHPQVFGGNGGQRIDREKDMNDPNEKFFAFSTIKIPFRTPQPNEKAVLDAIKRFAENYKKTLAENREVLLYQDIVDYDKLLAGSQYADGGEVEWEVDYLGSKLKHKGKVLEDKGDYYLVQVENDSMLYDGAKGTTHVYKNLVTKKMADGGEVMKHKHLEHVTIELLEPTSKGWKVKQIETHSIGGRKLSTPKEKVAYFSKEEIKDLFEPTMAMGGMMAKGGSIPNNYSFKTAKEVWEMWNFEQKNHFLLDHAEEIERAGFSPKGSWRSIAKNQSFNQLNDVVIKKLTEHISEGQYADGGYMADGGETKKYTDKIIEYLKKNGQLNKGRESIAKDGTKYRYDRYSTRGESANNWIVALFENAAEENGNRYATQFSYKDIYSISYDRPKYKGVVNGKITITELVEGDKMAKGGVIASSETKEGIEKLISDYYYSSKISLKKVDNKDEYEVSNSKGKINGVKVVLKRGRYQFINSDKMAKGGILKLGDKFGNYSVTLYDPIRYDDLGSSSGGRVKLVNQEDFDTLLIQYDHALRGGEWFISKDRTKYVGKNPYEVIEKLNLEKMAMGGTFASGVKAIEKRLVGTKVNPKYQKDYGKTYDKAEAHEAASKIKGKIRAMELAKKYKKKK
jgi:hypothetical protein